MNFGAVWNKDKKAEATLPDIEAAIFQMIFGWLYSGEIGSDTEDPVSGEDPKDMNWVTMARLYRAADYLMMAQIMNKIADMILVQHRKSKQAWSLKNLLAFLSHDITDLPLFYKLVLDSAVSWMTEAQPGEDELRSDLADIQEQYPQVMMDIIVRLNAYHSSFRSIAAQDWCTYHVHSDGQTCEGEAAYAPAGMRDSRQTEWFCDYV